MKRRILLVIGSFKTGGAERVTINTGSELQRRGFDVFYVIQKNIIELPHAIPPDRIFILRKSSTKNPVYKFFALFMGIFIVRLRVRPHAVIGFSRLSSFLACFTFAPLTIARLDANPFRLNKKQRRIANFIFFWPFIETIVVPSTGMYEAISKVKPRAKNKLIVIPNSINVSSILKLSEEPAKRHFDFPYVCAMGRLSHDKNFGMLIQAFAESSINRAKKLLIIGEGRLRPELEEAVRRLNMENRIIFIGFLNNPYPILKNADLLINTSTSESFCNVILEGLTLSLPVIATDCDYGPSDMIKNGFNGILIENRDKDGLVRILNRIGEDDSFLNKFRSNARESAEEFQLSSVIDKWIGVLS